MRVRIRGRYRPMTTRSRPPEPAGGYPVALLLAGAMLLGIGAIGAAMTGRSASPLTWYLSRAAGFTLYLLIWLTVMLGLGITTKLFDRTAGRGLVYSLHTFAMQLSYGFLAMHLLALVADAHIPFGVADLALPFASDGPEPWTGLGVLAMWFLVIIALSAPARRWISFRFWRGLHMLAFLLYGLALAHGIGAGTDSREPWSAGLYLTTALSVCCLVLFRVLRWNRRSETARPRQSGPTPLDRLAPPAAGL